MDIYRDQAAGKDADFYFSESGLRNVIFSPGTTAKEEKEEHGLGILNMMYAVKKYRGSLHREIRKKHGIMIYSLEILLFLPEDSVS